MTISYTARQDFDVSVVMDGRSAPRIKSFSTSQPIPSDVITALGGDRLALFIKSGEILTATTLPTLELDQIEGEAFERTIDTAWTLPADEDEFTLVDGALGLESKVYSVTPANNLFTTTLTRTDAEGHGYSQAVEVTITEDV